MLQGPSVPQPAQSTTTAPPPGLCSEEVCLKTELRVKVLVCTVSLGPRLLKELRELKLKELYDLPPRMLPLPREPQPEVRPESCSPRDLLLRGGACACSYLTWRGHAAAAWIHLFHGGVAVPLGGTNGASL